MTLSHEDHVNERFVLHGRVVNLRERKLHDVSSYSRTGREYAVARYLHARTYFRVTYGPGEAGKIKFAEWAARQGYDHDPRLNASRPEVFTRVEVTL